jgi:hypothetical protein
MRTQSPDDGTKGPEDPASTGITGLAEALGAARDMSQRISRKAHRREFTADLAGPSPDGAPT